MTDDENNSEGRGQEPQVEFVPAIILQNRGVPVTIYRLEDGKLPEISDDEERPTRTVNLRITANHAAMIEEMFDGIKASVPIRMIEPVLQDDGSPLVGPAGPVVKETVTGYETREFYGLEAFQRAMETRTQRTVRDVMAVVLGYPPEQMGEAMIPSEVQAYNIAVGVAWSISQGVDPTDAAKTLHKGMKALAAQKAKLAAELSANLPGDEEDDIPGQTGRPPG